ncbi:MAG: glycosyltransferase family 4 protein [Anaerolineae bacterium]|nr:glycosyltransferase family 4 protein [Anaerolineae bacterium]
MNLLMLSGDSAAAQGQEGPFAALLSRFAAHWARIDILCPPIPAAKPVACRFGNVYFHASTRRKLAQVAFIRQQGTRLLAERRYAVITSHDYGIFLNGQGARRLARQSGLPWVSELHHVEGYPRAATPRERLYRTLAQRYVRAVRDEVAAFRVVNQQEMPGFLRALGVPEQKIHVLPSLYLDFEIFRPGPAVPRYDVLFVGRLVPNKGLFTLLEALARVKAARPQVRLAILGQGPLRAALEKRILGLELTANVEFLPPAADARAVAHHYRESRMLVCASTSEGGPRVTVEAMACGVPVISTPVGVMGDLIVDEENGLLFHWDSAALAARILRLLGDADLRTRLGTGGQRSVAHFAATEVIAGYAQGLQRIAAEAAR